jgi:uncharacterized membrane protein
MRHRILLSLFSFGMFLVSVSAPLLAQEVHQELIETVRGEVIDIISEYERDITGTDTTALVQDIEVRILEGERKGDVARFETDLIPLRIGDQIFVNRLVSISGVEYYTFKDISRTGTLITIGVLFAGLLILLSGRQGVRSLAALTLSLCGLFFVLVPLLLNGYPPILVSVCVSALILAVALFVTHGIHAQSVIAFLGTAGAIMASGVLARLVTESARLTGLSSDEAIYLNFSTQGSLDFGALLLGGILIGMLGVLDDVAITQASVVTELKRANPLLSFGELYRGGLRVGRDHITSLVNTLSFAYIGVSLPLILLLVKAGSDLTLALNQELVAVELIRMSVGSIGLMLAVPLTTMIAAYWYSRHPVDDTHEGVHHDGHTHVGAHH